MRGETGQGEGVMTVLSRYFFYFPNRIFFHFKKDVMFVLNDQHVCVWCVHVSEKDFGPSGVGVLGR